MRAVRTPRIGLQSLLPMRVSYLCHMLQHNDTLIENVQPIYVSPVIYILSNANRMLHWAEGIGRCCTWVEYMGGAASSVDAWRGVALSVDAWAVLRMGLDAWSVLHHWSIHGLCCT